MSIAQVPITAVTIEPGTLRPAVYVGWGLGSFTTSVLLNSITLLHMRFMTDSLGIAAAVAGTLIGISKIYDAFIDPLAGAISDRTRSRWGRRRPFLLIGALGCAAAIILLFNVPHFESQQILVIYMGTILLFYNTVYTTFRTPYLALPPEITETFEQRSRLMTFSVYGSSIGSLFATTLAPVLLSWLGSNRAGHGLVAILLGMLILIGGLGCFFGTGAISPARMQSTAYSNWRTRWQALKENRPFLVLIAYKTAMFIGLQMHGVAVPYFTRHALKMNDAWLGSIFLARTLTMIVSQPFWSFLARRFGRRNALLFATITEIVCMTSWYFITPATASFAIIPAGFLQGFSGGGIFFGLYTALTDTMEYDRRHSGLQREGVFAGIFVMVEKFTTAAAAAMFGIMIGWLGYLESRDASVLVQPDSAIQGIYVALSIVPALLAAIACLILRHYELSEADLKSVSRRMP